jgi:hypothetical protein
MKSFVVLAGAISATAFVSVVNASVVFVDFGDSGQTTPGNYNNIIVNPQPTLSIANAVASDGSLTGIGIDVSGFFNGSNFSGPTSPSGAAGAIFPGSATRDNGFGHAAAFGGNPLTPQGSVFLTGLDTNATYDFTIFASRQGATDNRETKYSIQGINSGDALLNTSNNVSEVVSILSMQPTALGSLILTIEPGPNNNNASKFWYIGAMRMTAVPIPEPVTASLLTGTLALGLLRRR